MNFYKKIAFLAFLSIVSFSCDSEDEITEVDFNETISTTLTVDVPENSQGSPVTFTEITTIDFTTIQAIQDNINEIQDTTIDALSFEVDNYTGASNVVVSSASIVFNNTTIQVSNIDLQQADNNNTIFNIDDPAAITAIENALQNDTQATVSLMGTLSSSPVLFDVIIYLDVTVTASGQ